MRLRVLFFFALLLGAGFLAVRKGFGSSEGSGGNGDVSRRSAEVKGVAGQRLPLYFESRAAAAEFRPFAKDRAAKLYVPAAHAAVVLDADSGAVMHEQDAHERRQIASLTKMMTAMIAVERIKNLDEAVTIDEEAVYAEGTRVGCPRSGYCIGQRLKVGEQVSVRDLLKAALMNSANDAAIALGKHMGGSQEGFAEMMNQRAKELGLQDTHFCTPSGLDIDGRESECYSSAYDIAKITANALKYDVLWKIMQLPNTTIYSVDGKYAHDIFNTDALLGQYPNLLGTKTGFTPLAGYSLLAVASDPSGKHRVVAVVLNDPQRWQDIQSMFSWAFNSHVWR
jgi:D-alanyl-D-alanine carboxypeptidase (penicillin-binding protein 5/6)